jgi:cytoskeletal protein CcmA (bactofilin family)
MWKLHKEDELPFVPPPPQPVAAPVREPSQAAAPVEEPPPQPVRKIRTEMARIGQMITIKGELSGGEDLFVDGEVEGSIDLSGHMIIVGPNGRIHANIQAPSIVVFGRVQGNLRGSERVELKKSAVVSGDIFTQRVMIEEGAFFKGSVDIQNPEPKPEARRAFAVAASPPAPAGQSAEARDFVLISR